MNKVVSTSMEALAELLSTLAEKSNTVYWFSSADFKRILFVSPAYEEIWGRHREDLYEHPEQWISFMHPEDRKNNNPLEAMAERISCEGPLARYEENYRIIRPDGTVRWIVDRGFPIYNNENQCIGATGVAVDVTKEKQNEEQLRIAKEHAELANKLKTEFIQNMQHDIRTPISGIWSVLNGYLNRPDPEGLQKVLPLVVHAAEELLNICNEVIDFENAAYGDEQITMKPLSILDLTNAIVELNSAAIVARKLYMQLDIDDNVPEWIICDEHRLKKIIINLVGNAIKFTKQGGVTLRVILVKKEKTKCNLQFIIEDTGIGIPENKKEQIFDKFTRLNPSDNQLYKGTGLGLFIVKKFVEELGGRIEVKSVEGEGAQFIVSLSVGIATQTDTSKTMRRQHRIGVEDDRHKNEQEDTKLNDDYIKQSNEGSKQHLYKILMIEDDPLALFAAEHIWKQLAVKVSVDTAKNLVEGRRCLQKKTYDLVLADLGLPDGNGDELAREVKQNNRHRNYHTPLVALTAHNDLNRHRAALEAGFNTVLCKPLMVARAQHLLDVYVTERLGATEEHVEQDADMDDIIDWDLCLNMANGRESLARELLNALIATFPAEKKALTKAFQTNDIAAARAILHRFHGGLSYVGVPRLMAATVALQQQVRTTQDLETIQRYLDDFFEEMDTLIKHMN